MIVFLDGMFPAIFFPVGLPKDGGTCAYKTNYCQLYCPTQETNRHEIRALKYFQDNTVNKITEKIIADMMFYNEMHLYWWPWGDCLPEMTDKIISIMLQLNERGVLQNGYTRNPVLWEKVNKEIRDSSLSRLRIGFHVDTIQEAKQMSTDTIICCPDVTVNKAEMYYNGIKVGRCCGIWCDWLTIDEVRISDCQECYLYKQGCFFE